MDPSLVLDALHNKRSNQSTLKIYVIAVKKKNQRGVNASIGVKKKMSGFSIRGHITPLIL